MTNGTFFLSLSSLLSQSTLTSAKMIVCPELVDGDSEELQVPLPEDLFVHLSDSHDVIVDLLQRLPTMFANSKNVETAFGPALSGICAVQHRVHTCPPSSESLPGLVDQVMTAGDQIHFVV